MPASLPRACFALVVLVSLLGAARAVAFQDAKNLGAGVCTPYAPDTSAAELAYSPTGIYNPGTTVEKVMCVLPRDQESTYQAEEVGVVIFYRVLGSTPARMTCTLFHGSSTQMSNPVTTVTASGELRSAGGRGEFVVYGGPEVAYLEPATLICAIPPKTSFGVIRFVEFGVTQLP